MSISKEDVKKIASLSRLEFSENELEDFTVKLSNIVDFANTLTEIDVTGVKPTAHILDIKNVFRKDENKDSYPRGEILKNAPDSQAGCISVPKTVE